MAKNKLRKKVDLEKKELRKKLQGNMTPKGLKTKRKQDFKKFKKFLIENQDNIVDPEELGLDNLIKHEDIKSLKQRLKEKEHDDSIDSK